MTSLGAIGPLAESIHKLKRERNAVILAHYYQRPEVQDVADFVGDSLELSRQAATTNAEVIVFCGVHFMAETAAILSPQKIVLLPVQAECPMANMVTADALRARKREVPKALVVAYVNTSAAVKAESDICCTSANAVQVVMSLPPDQPIIFVPDKNLGRYVAGQTGRPLLLWEGWCDTHDRLAPDDIRAAKAAHPKAVVMVHPECRPEVTAMADFIASTTGLVKHAQTNKANEFIVGTEAGVLYQMRKLCPNKMFFPASGQLHCSSMRATTLEKVKESLENLQPRVSVAPDIQKKAAASLERMLSLS